MENFLIISILNFMAASIFLLAILKMYFAVKKNRENKKIRYYFYSFIFIAVYVFVSGLPVVVIKDPLSISVITFLLIPLLLIGSMFLSLTAINFTKFQKYEKSYIYLFLFVILLSSFLTFLGLSRSSLNSSPEFWFRPQNVVIVYGLLIAKSFLVISLSFTVLSYLSLAKKYRENEIAFGKSLMIAEGCFFFLLAVFFNNVIGTTAEQFFISNAVASIFYMTGAICFISSVMYRGKKYKT